MRLAGFDDGDRARVRRIRERADADCATPRWTAGTGAQSTRKRALSLLDHLARASFESRRPSPCRLERGGEAAILLVGPVADGIGCRRCRGECARARRTITRAAAMLSLPEMSDSCSRVTVTCRVNTRTSHAVACTRCGRD